MTVEYLIAFGGPVLIGLICFVACLIIGPRGKRAAAADTEDSLTSTLANAEEAARLAADNIAKVRAQLAVGAGPR